MSGFRMVRYSDARYELKWTIRKRFLDGDCIQCRDSQNPSMYFTLIDWDSNHNLILLPDTIV
jgi:hypothetical protein